jgi:hypothetical protein
MHIIKFTEEEFNNLKEIVRDINKDAINEWDFQKEKNSRELMNRIEFTGQHNADCDDDERNI